MNLPVRSAVLPSSLPDAHRCICTVLLIIPVRIFPRVSVCETQRRCVVLQPGALQTSVLSRRIPAAYVPLCLHRSASVPGCGITHRRVPQAHAPTISALYPHSTSLHSHNAAPVVLQLLRGLTSMS